MNIASELALARHGQVVREAELDRRARRIVVARRAHRRAERAACRARQAALQAALADALL